VCVFADVKSAQATAVQARVLGRVHSEIERQVQGVDEALRLLEDAFMFDLHPLLEAQMSATWVRSREHRDEALAVLDQASLSACHTADEASEDIPTHSTIIQNMVDAIARLKTQHSKMEQTEEQMAARTPGRDWAARVGQLHKLRQQRVQRPRILCSHAVSSRTGQGLYALRQALAGLMEDTRLFAHVGAKVPLNYSMLERLAQEGHEDLKHPSTPLLYRGHANMAKLDANNRTISFEPNFKNGDPSIVTIRSRQRCPVGSKGYYELQILKRDLFHTSILSSNLCAPRYGFASAAFTSQLGLSMKGVGDDAVSWAVDGTRQKKMNKGEQEEYGCKWEAGDVIGLACDLQDAGVGQRQLCAAQRPRL